MDPLTIHGQKVLYVSTQENFHGFPLDLSNVLIDKCNGQSLTMHSAKMHVKKHACLHLSLPNRAPLLRHNALCPGAKFHKVQSN